MTTIKAWNFRKVAISTTSNRFLWFLPTVFITLRSHRRIVDQHVEKYAVWNGPLVTSHSILAAQERNLLTHNSLAHQISKNVSSSTSTPVRKSCVAHSHKKIALEDIILPVVPLKTQSSWASLCQWRMRNDCCSILLGSNQRFRRQRRFEVRVYYAEFRS